jgi:hypothetical protein
MCAVFAHYITLASWAKASARDAGNAGNVLLEPREA